MSQFTSGTGIIKEVCVSSMEDGVAAARAGADRLELCAALEVGGLTPTIGLIERTVAAIDIPVVAMLRPRVGDFCYTNDEFETILADLQAIRGAGAAGVVFGFLDKRGFVDARRTRSLVEAADGIETIFHRAVDFVPDPLAAVVELAELGVGRTLTSGGAPCAIDATSELRAMIERTKGQMQILPCGGIRADHVLQLVEETGCNQVHFGPARSKGNKSLPAIDQLQLSDLAVLSSNGHRQLDLQSVSDIVTALS